MSSKVNERQETVAPKMPTAPQLSVPAQACDAHAHVFGPLERFPTGKSTYAIPKAGPAKHRQMLDTVGMEFGCLIQPAPYGDDPSALENALHLASGKLRGVAAANEHCTFDDLERMYRAGIRALRFNERLDPSTGKRFKGAVGFDVLRRLAPQLIKLGMHAQVWADIAQCVAIADEFSDSGLDLVFDHMAQPVVDSGIQDPDFQKLLSLVTGGSIWVKLTVCRVGNPTQGYRDLKEIHDALVDSNPGRMLWGSDWPFVRMGRNAPDVADLLDLFAEWVPDQSIRQMILVENPKRLFGF